MDTTEAEVMGSKDTSLKKLDMIETNREYEAQISMDSSQIKKRKDASKDKIEEIQQKEDDPCGICLAEEGVTYRGKLNCCDHYFCFPCIFEWSKVENRCPTCRQRFTTIFKTCCHSSKLWIFRVALRDQVHVPTDEEIGAQDPYADVHCTQCNTGDDENLLLLCDMCDSAAHTYCVGLGRTIPTGEWYCRECESSYNANGDIEEDEDEDCVPEVQDYVPEVQDYVPEVHNKCTSSRNRSITEASSTAEIVTKSNLRAVLPSSLMSRNPSNTPSRRRMPKRIMRRQVPRLSSAATAFGNPPQASITVSQVSGPASVGHSGGARTLCDRRLLQERVQAMRENWDALQEGRLQFCSRTLSDTNRIVDRANTGTQSAYKNCLNENRQRIGQTDIDQAWVLMERARSLGAKDLNFDDRKEVAKSYKAEKSQLLSSSHIDKQLSDARPPTSSRPVERIAVNSRVGRKSIGQQSNPVMKDRLSSVGLTLQPSSECPATSSTMLTFPTSDCEKRKGSNHAQMATIHKEEHADRLSRNLSGRSNKAEANSKEVILSLVKTHLMPIYKAKQLGSYRFKKIARISTHVILAACGLEHSEQSVQHFQKITCCHKEKQRLTPSLMCMSCNDCFGLFVKDVVNTICTKTIEELECL